MSKLTIIILAIMILNMQGSIIEAAAAAAAAAEAKINPNPKSLDTLHGDVLLRNDEEQIKKLEAKLAELKSTGSDGAVIQAYIDLAKEMKELNNERHALHGAVRGFEKGVGLFSEKIKGIIQKVNEILETQSVVAINNAKVAAFLQQPKIPTSTEEATINNNKK